MSPEARKAYDAMLAALKALDALMDFGSDWPSCRCFLNPAPLQAALRKARATIVEGEKH